MELDAEGKYIFVINQFVHINMTWRSDRPYDNFVVLARILRVNQYLFFFLLLLIVSSNILLYPADGEHNKYIRRLLFPCPNNLINEFLFDFINYRKTFIIPFILLSPQRDGMERGEAERESSE